MSELTDIRVRTLGKALMLLIKNLSCECMKSKLYCERCNLLKLMDDHFDPPGKESGGQDGQT